MKITFRFNAAARREALVALQHLRTKGSPLTVCAGIFLNSLGERLAVALGGLIVYVLCTFGMIYVRGLEEKGVKRKTDKEKEKSKSDTPDTS